jgi:hypothetical protein
MQHDAIALAKHALRDRQPDVSHTTHQTRLVHDSIVTCAAVGGWPAHGAAARARVGPIGATSALSMNTVPPDDPGSALRHLLVDTRAVHVADLRAVDSHRPDLSISVLELELQRPRLGR